VEVCVGALHTGFVQVPVEKAALSLSCAQVRDNAWQLTHQLLAVGKRGAWARGGYVVEVKVL